ncbi:MAG: YihY/virulence factor BrkB family protein [Acidobacteria bacterium]|nr:YihY/virulence factor BrkB family protein [Acidobacteriota bacterium]
MSRLFRIRSGLSPGAILIDTFRSMARHESPATAAAVAFFTLFSIFPLLLLIVAVSDRYFNLFDVRSAAIRTVVQFFPGLRSFIQNNIASVTPSRQIIFSSAVIFFWTGFWVVALLEIALNKAWHVQSSRPFLHSRLLALLMIFVGGFFLGTSVILTTAITLLRHTIGDHQLAHWVMGAGILWRVIFGATAVVLTFLALTLLYKLLPNTHVATREALTAGIVASSLWQIASVIFALLVRRLDYAAIYGPVGAVVALLSWVYLSSYIILFGAHLSSQMHRVTPEAYQGFPGSVSLPGQEVETR